MRGVLIETTLTPVKREIVLSPNALRQFRKLRANDRSRLRDAMRAALEAHMPEGCRWTVPCGGMFFWVELPEGTDAVALLPKAVEHGMAYVPGAAFLGSVAPIRSRFSAIAFSPSSTWIITGAELMKSTRPLKKGRSR